MGLTRTAWLQAAAWVLREAGEEEQGACGCWTSPRRQEHGTLGAEGQLLELLLWLPGNRCSPRSPLHFCKAPAGPKLVVGIVGMGSEASGHFLRLGSCRGPDS